MKLVTVSFCVFINLWPRPWPRPRDDWPRPRPRSLWPRPRPWPHELMASLTSLVITSPRHSGRRTAVNIYENRYVGIVSNSISLHVIHIYIGEK